MRAGPRPVQKLGEGREGAHGLQDGAAALGKAAGPEQPPAAVRGQTVWAGGPRASGAGAASGSFGQPLVLGALHPAAGGGSFLPSSPQVYFKTPSGELQTVLLQEAPAVPVAPSGTSCGSPVSRSPGGGSKKPAGRKERPLPKIAPAGGVISLSAAQLAAAAQAMQTININGVQVQGVPVTITNSGGGLRAAPGGGVGGGTGCGQSPGGGTETPGSVPGSGDVVAPSAGASCSRLGTAGHWVSSAARGRPRLFHGGGVLALRGWGGAAAAAPAGGVSPMGLWDGSKRHLGAP